MKRKYLTKAFAVAAGLTFAGGVLTPVVSANAATKHASLPVIQFGMTTQQAGFAELDLMFQNPNFCAPFGVQVNPTVIAATQLPNLTIAGHVNVALGGASQFAIAANAAGPNSIDAFAATGPLLYGLLAAPKITSISQLSNSTLVTTGAGSTGQLLMDAYLPRVGVKNFTWDYVSSGNEARNDLGSNLFTATASTVPVPAANLAQGVHVLYSFAKNTAVRPLAYNPFYANDTYFKHNQRTLKRFLNCIVGALKFADKPANQQAMIGLMEEYVALTPSDAATAYTEDAIGWQLFPFTVPQAEVNVKALGVAGLGSTVAGWNPSKFINTKLISTIKGAQKKVSAVSLVK